MNSPHATSQHLPTQESKLQQTCVERCNELINEYRSQRDGKVDTILALREILLESPSTRNGEVSTKLMSHGVKRPREDETQGENRRLKLSERMGGPAAKDMRVRAAETVPLRQIKPSLMKRISLPQSRLGPLIHQNSRGLSEERMHLPLYQRVSDKPMTNLTTSPPI